MPSPILAEVSDKMMSLPVLVAWNVVLILLALALAKKSRWFVLLPFAFALVLAAGAIEELRDPYVGPAVIHELGYGYVALSVLPLLAIAAVSARRKKNA
jgi:hypothetical protein